jgi:hypothetical protein
MATVAHGDVWEAQPEPDAAGIISAPVIGVLSTGSA